MGMQMHSREYLEHCVLRDQGKYKGSQIPGVMSEERKFDRQDVNETYGIAY